MGGGPAPRRRRPPPPLRPEPVLRCGLPLLRVLVVLRRTRGCGAGGGTAVRRWRLLRLLLLLLRRGLLLRACRVLPARPLDHVGGARQQPLLLQPLLLGSPAGLQRPVHVHVGEDALVRRLAAAFRLHIVVKTHLLGGGGGSDGLCARCRVSHTLEKARGVTR